MATELEKQISVNLQKIAAGVTKLATEKQVLVPTAELLTGGTPGIIPAGVRGFNIINLGVSGLGVTFNDIPVTGIAGITSIPKFLNVFGYSVEEDQDILKGPITVTPPATNHVLLQYLI